MLYLLLLVLLLLHDGGRRLHGGLRATEHVALSWIEGHDGEVDSDIVVGKGGW